MAARVTNPSEIATESREELASKVQELEVSCVELRSLPAGRAVYQKRGAILFLADRNAVTLKQQKEFEKARIKLQKFEQ